MIRTHPSTSRMEFEDFLHEVGGFGRYQKLLLILFTPCFLVIPWYTMNPGFLHSEPDHWCLVPQLVLLHNVTSEMRCQMVRPPADPLCTTWDVDWSEVLARNLSVDPNWPTKECDAGWEYDRTHYDATSVTRWNMVCKDSYYSSLVVSLMYIGALVGMPVFGVLSDKLGRKPTFFIMAVVIAVSEIGSVLSPYFALFLVLRTVIGASMVSIFVVVQVIIQEVVRPGMRAVINGVMHQSWTLGVCLLSLVAYLTRNWIKLSIVMSSSAAAILLYWMLLPESPRWLISRERYEEAAKIMAKISKSNGKKAHEGSQLLDRIKEFGANEKKKRGESKHSPLDFIRYPVLRKRFILVTICWIGNCIAYYGVQLNTKNLAGNEFLNFFLVALVEFPAHMLAWYLLEKLGRRWCSILSFTLSTLSCLIPTILIADYGSVGVVASLFAKAGTSAASMTLFQQAPELFPTPIRGMGISTACSIGTGSTMVIPYIVGLSKYGAHLPFIVFASISFLSGICASCLPETINRNLPQTVDDVETFRDTGFFSCGVKKLEEDEKEHIPSTNTWTPRLLSALDLSSAIYESRFISEEKTVSSTLHL